MTEKHPTFDVKIKHSEQIEKRFPDVHAEDFEDKLCDLAEELFVKQNEIGVGNSADIFKDDDPEVSFCYKVIDRQSFLDLDPEDEANFMEKVKSIDSSVYVPLPIATVSGRNIQKRDGSRSTRKVLLMDKIDGYTIAQVCADKYKLPKNYDHEKFFYLLKNFISNINKNGIYHRDLHAGNVMIDNKTGNPVVIDFGRSYEKSYEDDNPYKPEDMYVKNPETGLREKTIVTFKSDELWVKDLEKIMRGIREGLTD